MPPVGMQRQGQPHVSSSTHPQNMGMLGEEIRNSFTLYIHAHIL